MSLITFDIKFKNKVDNDSVKLLPDSELQQLKLMICGKYKIYDLNNLFIYYKGNLITESDITKIKEIFKMKKVRIEISESPIEKKTDAFKYFCKCKSGATSICDKCDEFLCDNCFKKKKHINHTNKIIKLQDYHQYIKTTLKEFASELDNKILNDEAYQFFQYWGYDVENEVNNINNAYEYIKNQLEDIKQLQIDYIMALGEANKYEQLKQQIENVINQYANIDTEAEFEKIFEEKKLIMQSSKEILTWYNELKNQCLNYTKTIKDIQTFNQILLKEVKDKFNITKKRYSQLPFINNFMNGSMLSKSVLFNNNANNLVNINNNMNHNIIDTSNKNDFIDTSNKKENQASVQNKLATPKSNANNNFNTESSKQNKNGSAHEGDSNEKDKDNYKENSPFNEQSMAVNESLNMSHMSAGKKREKILFKLKDDHRIIIFFIAKQSFKEKNFYDKGNFRRDFTTEADVIQLNLYGKLFMLGGKNFNRFYYYDFPSNSIYYINNSLYSHYYGSMVYCPKYNMIYLLGGNNQIRCEACYLNTTNLKKLVWKSLPSLNEERQEFATIYFDDYIYVFFGFSSKKGINLSSIERINVNTNTQFEVVYVNEQITLSSLGCANFVDDAENNKEGSEGILLLGGFDGQNYVDTSLVFNPREMKIRDCDIVIPNMSKHFQFLFHKESAFIEFDNGAQLIFDMKNNVHLLTSDSYELFSEAQ
jgi:hypothetical protein